MARLTGLQVVNLGILLLVVTTLLFFLLRKAGDPASVLAGSGATPEQLALVRTQYGLDQPLWVQFGRYVWNILHLDFGASLSSGEPALAKVLERVPRSLQLAGSALGLSIVTSIPLGAWLGSNPQGAGQRVVASALFLLQGMPGFVTALLLVQVFSVQLRIFPSMGYSADNWMTWVLPTLSLTLFSAPSLIRVVAANVAAAMQEPYVQTARAYGASPAKVVFGHALPNAVVGAAALIGVQAAHLLSGSAIIETIFSWPGMGWLLLQSVQSLDFPVVQAEAFVIAIIVFAVNLATDLSFVWLDPQLRTA
jgi:ABC-type dipeptide/oligopeptide/nickel transport system permease component